MTERDAWAAIYRLYEEYAPALRQAATLDDDNVMAGNLFTAAAQKTAQQYDDFPPEGQLILLAGFDILDEVFKDAKKRCQPG